MGWVVVYLLLCVHLFYPISAFSDQVDSGEPSEKEIVQRLLNEQLLSAAQTSRIDKVTELVERGADPNTMDENGLTVTAWAAGKGNLPIVMYLVENGADPEKATETGITALSRATFSCQKEVVRYLLGVMAKRHPEKSTGVSPWMMRLAPGCPELQSLFENFEKDIQIQRQQQAQERKLAETQASASGDAQAELRDPLPQVPDISPLLKAGNEHQPLQLAPKTEVQEPPKKLLEIKKKYSTTGVPYSFIDGTSRTSHPGVSVSSPSGVGSDKGTVLVGGVFQGRKRDGSNSQGSLYAGMGLGDASKNLGAEITLSFLDLGRSLSDAGISVTLHRQLGNGFSAAVGRENLALWGSPAEGRSFFGVVTKSFLFRIKGGKVSLASVSLGLGDGRFRSPSAIATGSNTVGVFSNMELQMWRWCAFYLDWTGQDLNLGLGLFPFREHLLSVTPMLADLTGNAGDGARFVMTVNYRRLFF